MMFSRSVGVLQAFSRSYIPVVVKSKTRMSQMERMAWCMFFLSPYFAGIGLCHLIKQNPVEYRGPKLIEEK